MNKPGSRRLIVTLDVPESVMFGVLDISRGNCDILDREFGARVDDYEIQEFPAMRDAIYAPVFDGEDGDWGGSKGRDT